MYKFDLQKIHKWIHILLLLTVYLLKMRLIHDVEWVDCIAELVLLAIDEFIVSSVWYQT